MQSQRPNLIQRVHNHLWLVGLVGVLAGAGLMFFVPRMAVVAGSAIAFAGFHLLGAVVVLSSAVYLRALRQGRRAVRATTAVNFGWGAGWMNGLGVVALVTLALALFVQIAAPAWWPAAFALLLLGFGFAAGSGVIATFRQQGYAVLPMVGVFRTSHDRVLDIGCGAGRTTLAVGAVLPAANIVALDRFDAPYIDGGGRTLFENNLCIKGMQAQVHVQEGDICAMPFAAESFDAAVSTAVYDHLGSGKQKGLDEAYRVLKPGGRFLMSVWVPGWAVFAVGNVFSLLLSSRSAWRLMAARSGFEIVEEGFCNFSWFLLLQKPGIRQ